MSILTVFVYTTDIENTSASDIQDALNGQGITAEDVCVRPVEDMPVKPPLVTTDGHVYSHNGNCCRTECDRGVTK